MENVGSGYDFTESSSFVTDRLGHGTAVAGLIDKNLLLRVRRQERLTLIEKLKNNNYKLQPSYNL